MTDQQNMAGQGKMGSWSGQNGQSRGASRCPGRGENVSLNMFRMRDHGDIQTPEMGLPESWRNPYQRNWISSHHFDWYHTHHNQHGR